jgi:salicylate hydroxylase
MSANRPNKESGVDAPGELSETLTTTSYPSNVLNFLRKLRKSPGLQNSSSSNARPLQAKVRLTIVIVGAGLGGLATSMLWRDEAIQWLY